MQVWEAGRMPWANFPRGGMGGAPLECEMLKCTYLDISRWNLVIGGNTYFGNKSSYFVYICGVVVYSRCCAWSNAGGLIHPMNQGRIFGKWSQLVQWGAFASDEHNGYDAGSCRSNHWLIGGDSQHNRVWHYSSVTCHWKGFIKWWTVMNGITEWHVPGDLTWGHANLQCQNRLGRSFWQTVFFKGGENSSKLCLTKFGSVFKYLPYKILTFRLAGSQLLVKRSRVLHWISSPISVVP